MTSGSDNTETKEPVDSLRQRQESNAAAATESPSLPPQSGIVQDEVHGPPEAGGRNPSTAATETPPLPPQSEIAEVAEKKAEESTSLFRAAEQKAEETSLFWSTWGRGTAGGKPPLPPRPPRARGPSSTGGEGVLARIMGSRIDLKDVFDELMLESQRERSGETDQESEEGMPEQQNEQAKSPPKKGKKPLWRKVLDGIGISNQKYTLPHVNYQKVPMTELIRHYNLLEMVVGRKVEFYSCSLNLQRIYSEFRPVHGDGECFYRSFIFSYLEQVLDRQDTHEEHRVLAAVKRVARQHARLGWASEFSRSQKAFKKLIKKVMRWKTHRRLKHVPTANSYRIEKLLEFFNDYKRTVDIFAFLRLVAAIWICSHNEEFIPLIPELNEGYTLTEWCFQEVVQRKVFADHIQITALVRALRVPLRVEHLFQENGQDLYIGQDSQDDMPRSTCWPRHHHQVPPDHEVPRVTVLYSQEHYDIIYPAHPPVAPGESSGQQPDKTESLGTKSPSQTSSQQIDRVEGSTSTGEKSDKHTAEGGS